MRASRPVFYLYNVGMKIEFVHSLEDEITRLVDLGQKYQWFLDNNFPIILPDFYDEVYESTREDEISFQARVTEELTKIYNPSKYAVAIAQARENWSNIEDDFPRTLNELGLEMQANYKCYISLYGPSGQFFYPNIINLRVATATDTKETNVNLAHEIIHLSIYKRVKELGLDYDQTEGVVDLIFTETKLKALFPSYQLQIGIPHDKNWLAKFMV